MTDESFDSQAAGEEQGTPAPPPAPGSFGDQAAEMANESEVEEPTPADDELTVTKMELAERTSDLQRLQAEFMNYKRRVERDRELIKENATYAALAPIVEVLDTVDRAREHAQTSGQSMDPGFAAVADQLERTVAALGLAKFGMPGEAFDPTVHEALSHIGEDPEVQVTTCKVIAKAGYRIGDRVVRAAQVLVVDPPSGPTE
ncbi:nucleotide exchange factor GrpE [Nocardioides caricicola]|uniref:Protein GrpE n=1 Tax=Nocardioides caricicola TaxID=634770 RepID=A0ABW0MX53_9ACTN